jgi:hypothetical protein
MPTAKQIDFAVKLAGERVLPTTQGWSPEPMKRMVQMKERIEERNPNGRDMHDMIDWLLRQPELPSELVGAGVYELDGTIIVVKPNREKTRCYAKKVVESPPRMTEVGEVVDFELEYALGLIRDLREEHRMPKARAIEFTTRYGRCIVCGRHLKAAKSVEAGIGPVCIKYFA